MGSRATLLSFSTCLLTVAVSLPWSAHAKDAAPTPEPYPEAVVNIFVDSCVAEGGKTVPPEIMQQICGCSIEGIQTQYTLEEFVKISRDLEKEKPMPAKMTEIVEGCAASAKQ